MKRPTVVAVAFVAMMTIGLMGMLFALMRDPACAWVCAIGNVALFTLDLMAGEQ